VVPTQESVTFNIEVTDVDSVGTITAIELYQGETLIEALTDLSLREFTGLLSNNEYQVKVTYTYDLNDGIGEQTEVVTYAINSVAKAVPTVEINTVVPTQESVTFNIEVTDVDSVGTITAIELYQGETLIEALTDLSLREFTGLLSNNEYTIKVTYTYDLNDGVGSQTLAVNQVETTLPQNITISTFLTLNQQISTGQIAIFEVNVINPDNVKIDGIVINGMILTLDSTSSTTTLRFRFVINDGMGIANYNIESFVLSDGYYMNIYDNTSIEFFVMANVYVVDFIQSEGNFYGKLSDTYTVTFNQPISTFINSIMVSRVNPTTETLNIEDIVVLDDYTIEIPVTSIYLGTINFKIVSIEFEVDSIKSTTNLDYEMSITIINDEISYIETVDDLLNMVVNDYRLYILKNDIDFTGINWTPINFYGALMGNGYKFTNLTIIDYSSTTRVEYSIFGNNQGLISDLSIDNLFISAEKNNDVKIAGLVINNYGIVNNVNLSGIIDVISNGTSEIGGISVDNHRLIANSSSNITIVNNSKTAYIGGITAINSSSAIIRNTEVSSSINSSTETTYSNHYIGGLTGYNQGSIDGVSVNTFLNVHSSFIYTGGLIGYNNGSIINSLTKGIVNSTLQTGYSYGYSSGFVGFNSQTGSIENSYSYVNSNISNLSLNWSSGFVGENQGIVKNSFSSGTGFNQPFVQTQSGIFASNYSLNTNNAISTNGLTYKESIVEINDIMSNLWDNCIWDFSQIDYITVTYPIFK
jgi:hypothetical protein